MKHSLRSFKIRKIKSRKKRINYTKPKTIHVRLTRNYKKQLSCNLIYLNGAGSNAENIIFCFIFAIMLNECVCISYLLVVPSLHLY